MVDMSLWNPWAGLESRSQRFQDVSVTRVKWRAYPVLGLGLLVFVFSLFSYFRLVSFTRVGYIERW